MQQPISVLVVDDESLGRERIVDLLGRDPNVEVMGECADGLQALGAIVARSPELVFLDVQMPELDGLGVVDALSPEQRPEIIFATAYDKYAVRAFAAHAIDYLLKPYTDSRFEDALRVAQRRVVAKRQESQIDQRLTTLLEQLRDRESNRWAIRDSDTGAFHVVNPHEIVWVEAGGDSQVGIQLESRCHVCRKTLSEIESRLDPSVFLRVHRSYLVNSSRISTVQPLSKGEYLVTMEIGKKIRTGRGYREVIERFLER